MRFDSKRKVYYAVMATTAISVLFSVLVTGLFRGSLNDPSTFLPSILVPLCVAPVVSFWGFTQAFKIEGLNKKLSTLLNHDPLTNVHSRSFFFETADNIPASEKAVILMIDADHFKKINDSFGHDVGDKALCHLSNLISEHCRKTDVVARLGGEEFGVYMPKTDIPTAQGVAERIRSGIFSSPLIVEDIEIPLSVSIGVAALRPRDQIDLALKRADIALYQAKSQGRNRVCLEEEQAPAMPEQPAQKEVA